MSTAPTIKTIKFGGEAGFGIMLAGLTFCRIAIRSGYNVFAYSEYPSLVRGGHNVMAVTFGESDVNSPLTKSDYLVALNQETIDKHADSLNSDGWILYDPNWVKDLNSCSHVKHCFAVPLTELLKSISGPFIMRNNIAIGAVVSLLGGNLKHLEDLVKDEFKEKEKILAQNLLAIKLGFDYVQTNFINGCCQSLADKKAITTLTKKIVVTGNEAAAMASIAAGMQFSAIYPMTPTSNILHYLAANQDKFGYIYKQPEDEIAAINMAIGASFAGARSMVATSGGGFCLMTEAVGLAGITETPIVILMGMRGGPSTGLPTYTEQGDLKFVLNASHSDFARIVLAAGDIDEVFNLTLKAFNLADKYQTPVVVLLDKYLCESHKSTMAFDTTNYQVDRGKLVTSKIDNYARYKLEDDGISARSVPGSGNHFVANSDEHTEEGFSDDSAQNRLEQMEKRMKKLKTVELDDLEAPVIFGDQDADITIVSWGSNKGAILDALNMVKSEYLTDRLTILKGHKFRFIHNVWMNPFPTDKLKELLTNSKEIISFECSYSGQYASLIREKTGIEIKNQILKYDGRPFYPEEILEHLADLVVKLH